MKFVNNKRLLIIFLIGLGLFKAKETEFQITNTEVLFIYNAKSGLFNSLTDFLHKELSPTTYKCNLCKITYDKWTQNQRWSDYINSLPINVKFTYKDLLFQSNINIAGLELPLALIQNNGNQSVFLNNKEINSCSNQEALIRIFNLKLKSMGIIE